MGGGHVPPLIRYPFLRWMGIFFCIFHLEDLLIYQINPAGGKSFMERKAKQKKKSGIGGIIVAVIIILASCGMLFYPFISNYLYDNRTDSLISTYEEEIDNTDDALIEEMLAEAREYNEELVDAHVVLTDPFQPVVSTGSEDDILSHYYDILNVGEHGYMGYLEIPAIEVHLPIYHSTSDTVLELGVGHLEGSSFPIGGENTHSILSAHTGINNAKMFTDLTVLEEGDHFYISVLGDTLAYQVDQIKIVEPDDTSDLNIVNEEDYVTLVTCTPYGINSHRLLVRGTRVEYIPEVVEEEAQKAGAVVSGSQWMGEYLNALAAGIGIVVGLCWLGFAVHQFRMKWKVRH